MEKKNENDVPETLHGMTLGNIAEACGGTYIGAKEQEEQEITGAVTDSRQVKTGYLFIPIRGARVDGHDFIPQVFEKGALAVLSEHKLENPAGPYILVDSSAEAMKKIAAFYRSQLTCKVVGITGSVGKTSTKEMIASVLEQRYKVLKTEGNFNNEIGLPLTIFKIRAKHEVAVLEMGISDFGEMHRLARMNIAIDITCQGAVSYIITATEGKRLIFTRCCFRLCRKFFIIAIHRHFALRDNSGRGSHHGCKKKRCKCCDQGCYKGLCKRLSLICS